MLHIATPRPVSAYWDQSDSAQGVLIFFDGNGYGAEAALRRLLVPTRALHLELIAFNYYDEGQSRPSMAEMRAIGDALFDAAQAFRHPRRVRCLWAVIASARRSPSRQRLIGPWRDSSLRRRQRRASR
jgi:hypothetical protein